MPRHFVVATALVLALLPVVAVSEDLPTPTATTRFVLELGRPDKVWTRSELAAALQEECHEARARGLSSDLAALVDLLGKDGTIRSDGSLDAGLQVREVALACIEAMPVARPFAYTRGKGVTPVREILSTTVGGEPNRFHVTALDAKDVPVVQAGAREWAAKLPPFDPLIGSTKLKDGTTVLQTKSGGSTAVVTLVGETKPAKEVYGSQVEPGQVPKAVRVVKDLRIVVDGTAVFVPRSAYRDLGWVDLAKVVRRGTGWLLVVAGGDASESFVLEIVFDGTAVRKRTLYGGEADAEPLEVTTYYQVTLD